MRIHGDLVFIILQFVVIFLAGRTSQLCYFGITDTTLMHYLHMIYSITCPKSKKNTFSKPRMILRFRGPVPQLLLQTFPLLAVFVYYYSTVDCSCNIQEIFAQAAAAGVRAQQHDNSPKLMPKHLNCSLVAGCQLRKQFV